MDGRRTRYDRLLQDSLAMQLLNGWYLALLGWQMYTLTHSSPLNLPSTLAGFNLDLVPEALPTSAPTPNVVALAPGAQSTSLPSLTPNTTLPGSYPPDPCVVRLPGSTVSVEFYSRHYLKENRVQEVLRAAQIDCNQHNPALPMYKAVPKRYSAGKTTLRVPGRYQGDFKWGQWSLGLDAVRAYMEWWDWLGCEFHVFDHTLERWYYGGSLLVDFMQNVTTVQNETVIGTE